MTTTRRSHLSVVGGPAATTSPAADELGTVEIVPGAVRAAVVDRDGTVTQLSSERLDLSGRSTADVVLDVAERCFAGRRLAGVGVACPGLVDTSSGVIVDCLDLPDLNGVRLADGLRARTGAPAWLEHRARLQVIGDRWFGPGLGRRTFASVSTGETLGVGILFEGQVLAPRGGRSGAHMIVAASTSDPCTCGSTGCWKSVATTAWLRRRAAEVGLAGVDGLADLLALSGQGGAAATALVEEYADNLALGLVNVQHLFVPGLFIVHGEARAGGEPFLERIEARLRAVTSFDAEAERPQLVVAAADEDVTTLLGAAGLVLSHQR